MMQNGLSWESVARREAGPIVIQGVLQDGNENTANPTINTKSVPMQNLTVYAGQAPDWIEHDITYLRLQELRLSYSIPQKFLKQTTNGFIGSASLYVTGNDLYVWTNYTGLDAVGNTVAAAAGGVGGEGYDTYAIPSPRGISAGLSVTFYIIKIKEI
jgi:hypothetical protein